MDDADAAEDPRDALSSSIPTERKDGLAQRPDSLQLMGAAGTSALAAAMDRLKELYLAHAATQA